MYLSLLEIVLRRNFLLAGRVHHALNNHQKAVEYLRQGLQIAEQLGRMEDEAKIRHRLGLALWGNSDYEECQQQLYKASELFESIRRDAQFNSEYKLSLFDLQTACYQALQVGTCSFENKFHSIPQTDNNLHTISWNSILNFFCFRTFMCS